MLKTIKKYMKQLDKVKTDFMLMKFISDNFLELTTLRYSSFYEEYRAKVTIFTSGGTLEIFLIRYKDGDDLYKVEFQKIPIAKWRHGFLKIGSYVSGPYQIRTLDSFNLDMMEPFINEVKKVCPTTLIKV
jgi:hypothetical protein